MSETKFTPGPWKVTDTGDVSIDIDAPYYEALGVGVNDQSPFCVIISRRHVASRLEANARLISSAPDLYEALDSMMKKYSDVIRECKHIEVANCGDAVYDSALSALKKARC